MTRLKQGGRASAEEYRRHDYCRPAVAQSVAPASDLRRDCLYIGRDKSLNACVRIEVAIEALESAEGNVKIQRNLSGNGGACHASIVTRYCPAPAGFSTWTFPEHEPPMSGLVGRVTVANCGHVSL